MPNEVERALIECINNVLMKSATSAVKTASKRCINRNRSAGASGAASEETKAVALEVVAAHREIKLCLSLPASEVGGLR
jgi:hypothetical protein